MRFQPFCAALGVALVTAAAPAAAQSFAAPDDARPAAPAGFAASFAVPARDEGGAYRTPNRALSAAETTWHVRTALNVAALGCGGADAAAMPAAYNALLVTAKAQLAAANEAAVAGERARWARDWEARHDAEQTRLYNFWAQPPAQAGFCAVARVVLAEAASVPPEAFPAFAAAALPRLEAPFLAAFARWEAYRAAVTAWEASHLSPQPKAAPVVLAAAAPVAPGPVAATAPAEAAMLPAGLVAIAAPVPAMLTPTAEH